MSGQCPSSAKLPGLYLIDSIVKNHKEPFISLFARNLPLVSPCWKQQQLVLQTLHQRPV